jgi:hypothetical protein
MTAPTLDLPRRSARMARYALWQWRDFAINIGLASLLLFGLLGMLTIMQVHLNEDMARMAKMSRELPVSIKLTMFEQVYAVFAMVAPIICVSGIVSQDRALGYTRFLFAKPQSVRWYYFQSLLVRFLGFLLLGHLLLLAYAHFEPPAYTPRFLADLVVSFVLVGGVVFLLSVLSRFDGLIAIVVLLVSSVIWGLWRAKDGIRYWVTYLLPPVEKVGDMHDWVLGFKSGAIPFGATTVVEFPWKWALWGAGYGLACIALGLYLLRRIPLTKA